MGIFAVIGLILLAVALGLWSVGSRFRSGALSTQGTVVRMVNHRDSEGGSGHLPIVQYRVDTQSYEVAGTVSSTPPAYHVGDLVPILYRPEKPEDGRIDSMLEQGFLPLLFGGLGGVFFLIGVFGVLGGLLFGRR
jgi:hypothetical protein